MNTPKSRVVTVRVVGPLEPYPDPFRSLLAERGYAPLTRVRHLQVMVHLSKWLQTRSLGVHDLSGRRIEEYLAERNSSGYTSFCSQASLSPLLEVLAAAGAPLTSPDAVPASPVEPVERLLLDYARFLGEERGLASSTTAAYVLRARRFVERYGHGADLSTVDTAVVTTAVLREADRVTAGSAQFFAVALRAFLRYCHLIGALDTDLSAASLAVTGRRRSFLPQGISGTDARALLDACDQQTTRGLRDYAVILLLMRLGLRSCEVAALRLEDMDWRAGLITVRGKGHRFDQLPLPTDVGEAIAAYLRHARPETARREIFVRMIAPLGRSLCREAVQDMVRRACRRAGLAPLGTHRLRHGLASDLVRQGAPLNEIGQILRHDDPVSTSIYARVDVEQLRTIARPVPSGGLQ